LLFDTTLFDIVLPKLLLLVFVPLLLSFLSRWPPTNLVKGEFLPWLLPLGVLLTKFALNLEPTLFVDVRLALT